MSEFQFTVTYAPILWAVVGSILCSAVVARFAFAARRR